MENSLLDDSNETTQRIEETVKGILKESDMDQMTEFKLRIEASSKLGFELSSTNHKKLVRDVLEAFLLSNPMAIDDEIPSETVPETTVVAAVPVNKEKTGSVAPTTTNRVTKDCEDERFIYKVSENRNVWVDKYEGRGYLSIGKKNTTHEIDRPFIGMHFSSYQWSAIKNNFSAIDEAIKHFQSKQRTESTQNGDTSEPVDNKNITNGFSRIEISRFDGKSYLRWASKTELFLKQLNLSYVLSEPCPVSDPENWLRDDYLCHSHVLNSLSDQLYRQYTKKFKHAKELWDELKWVHQCEESNSKRSQVRKYIEFEMVEERSVLEQVQDFNKIADSIVSAGMFLDETFHVSTIISKFPESWRGFCNKLMEEEFLPVWMLMERVKTEEEVIRNAAKEAVTYRPVTGSFRMERRPSLGLGSQSIGWKRKESERDGRGVVMGCDNCGRKGHIAKNCWGKRLSDERKPNRVSSSVPVVSETQATNND